MEEKVGIKASVLFAGENTRMMDLLSKLFFGAFCSSLAPPGADVTGIFNQPVHCFSLEWHCMLTFI